MSEADELVEAVAKALRDFDLSEANAGLATDEEFRGFYHNAARAAITAARAAVLEGAAWAAHCACVNLAFSGKDLAPADYSNAVGDGIRALRGE